MPLCLFRRKINLLRLSISILFSVLLIILWNTSSSTEYDSIFSNNKNRFNYTTEIPKLIHSSWKTKQLPKAVENIGAVNSWKTLNKQYHYKLWTDEEIDEFVRTEYPNIYNGMFLKLPRKVMKSDLFRYLILLKEGGVWSDVDTICLQPIEKWYNNSNQVRAVIGVELDASDVSIDWFSVRLQLCQWTIVAAPGHPLINYVVDYITRKYNNLPKIPEKVHTVTGPTIWTEAILKYFSSFYGYKYPISSFRYLKEPVLVAGDVLVLPVTAFSPDNTGMGGRGPTDAKSFVQHLFQGSWKRY
jgi:alpha 1,6-mannosyltransferase